MGGVAVFKNAPLMESGPSVNPIDMPSSSKEIPCVLVEETGKVIDSPSRSIEKPPSANPAENPKVAAPLL